MSIIKQEYEYNETWKKGELPMLANCIAKDDPNKKKPDTSKKRPCQQYRMAIKWLSADSSPKASVPHAVVSMMAKVAGQVLTSKHPNEDKSSGNSSQKKHKKDMNIAK
jgi:hypothetical protein